MKTIFIAIIFFIIGFIVGGGMGFKMSLNFSYDKMSEIMKDNLPVSIGSGNITLNKIYEEQKQKIINEISAKKEEFINNIKQQAKDYISKQIDNMFK